MDEPHSPLCPPGPQADRLHRRVVPVGLAGQDQGVEVGAGQPGVWALLPGSRKADEFGLDWVRLVGLDGGDGVEFVWSQVHEV